MENLTEVLGKIPEKMNKDFPTTMVNGREVPVCPGCGRVTDMGPAGLRDCQFCMQLLLNRIGNFNI